MFVNFGYWRKIIVQKVQDVEKTLNIRHFSSIERLKGITQKKVAKTQRPLVLTVAIPISDHSQILSVVC